MFDEVYKSNNVLSCKWKAVGKIDRKVWNIRISRQVQWKCVKINRNSRGKV